ncbi:MAG: cell division protein [Oscillospiraceae bacterium]|nr:cell division protein [Oscillospiraceae bacterium]
MNQTYYTAVGRFEKRSDGLGLACPVIIIHQKEYMVDLQEMIVWTSLNWLILRQREILQLYAKAGLASGVSEGRSCAECLDRLLIRGLVISGSGGTGFDALYDLLNSLYVIPATGSFGLRLFSFLKLTLWNGLPFASTRKLLQKDRRSADEEQIMQLSKQALLSTAELIKCVDQGVRDLSSGEKILGALYNDDDTTSDNIGSLMRVSRSKEPVTLAVANLYLRKQIIFERI